MTKKQRREWFFSQSKNEIKTVPEAGYSIYELAITGHTVCEHTIKLGLSEPIEIALIADPHLNICSIEDEADEEIYNTRRHRPHFRDGEGIVPFMNALNLAECFDLTAVLGDVLDYKTEGTVSFLKSRVIGKYPDIIMNVADHDITKEVLPERRDLLTYDERLASLSAVWPHDVDYYVRKIDKVRFIALNSEPQCYGKHYGRLSAEISDARAAGEYIIILQHRPIATANSDYRELMTCFTNHGYGNVRNFYDAPEIIGSENYAHKESNKLVELITSSADVIAAIFDGHYHNQFFTKIEASCKKDGKTQKTYIPQHTVPCAQTYDKGYVMRVIIE